MNKLILALVFLMTGLVLQSGAQINAILERVDTHRKAVTTLRADIKMMKVDPVTEEVDTSEGKLIYVAKTSKRDMMMRIDWKTPKVEILSVAEGKYVAYNPKSNQAYTGVANSNEVSKRGGSVLAFMNMSKMQIKENYTASLLGQETLSGSVAVWHLKFTPKTKTGQTSAEVWVDKDGMIVQARVISTSKDESLFRLTGIVKNLNLSTAQFVVKLPGNVNVVKG